MAVDGIIRNEETEEIFQIRQSSVNIQPHPRIRETEETDQISEEGSELQEADGSVVSSVTDRYGFMSGDGEETEVMMVEPKTDLEIVRRREVKWVGMMSSWDSYMMRNYKKVRERCRKGIPPSCRARGWLHLCGASYQMEKPENRNTWSSLMAARGDSKCTDDIEKDLHRNFPTHELFGGEFEKIGRAELYKVLKAYSVHNPADGYCQAQAPLAALLLMNMPSEQAFWCLVAICERYIPGYYSPGMEAIQLDGDILFGLLKKVSPRIYRHLKTQNVEPILYMTEWFLCIFSRTLPWSSVLRIWDMFLCEGVKILFRVALVLIKSSLPHKVRRKCPSMYETLDRLKHLPQKIVSEEFLIPEILKLDITEEDMEREHRKQLRRRQLQQQERMN